MNMTVPKENTEYTFIFGEKKIYKFVFDYRLPNGRLRFRCRNADGSGSAWFTDMDGKRFSYVHKFNRDPIKFPDVPVKQLPEVKTAEEIIKTADEARKAADKAAENAKFRAIASVLDSLTEGQKNIAKKYKISVKAVICALCGDESVYPNTLVGTLALKRDVTFLSDVFNLRIEL